MFFFSFIFVQRFLSSHQLLVQYFQSSTLSLLAAVHFLPVRDIGPRFDPLADCPACSTMKTTWLGPDNSAVHFCLGNPGNRKPETAGSEERTKAIGYNLRELIRMHVHRVLALLTRQAGRDNPGFTEKKKKKQTGKGGRNPYERETTWGFKTGLKSETEKTGWN